MTQEQRKAAKSHRQNTRDSLMALTGAVVTLLAIFMPDIPPEAIAPMTTILTIMVLRGHPST